VTKTLFFAYDVLTSPELLRQELPGASEGRPARLDDHRLAFAPDGEEAAFILPSPGDHVLGTAYEISEDDAAALARRSPGFHPESRGIRLVGEEREALVLVPDDERAAGTPSDRYLGRVREGLTSQFPVSRVDAYLKGVLGSDRLFRGMVVQPLADAVFNLEYNCRFRRLYPWKGMVRTPWGSAWGVVAPGTQTSRHGHDEEETALILAGRGEVHLEGRVQSVSRGDVIFFPPEEKHTILNTSADEDLEVLFIWWGGVEMEKKSGIEVAL
jgi:mannose-6-phosphate isomerase-like protein (cupin superfamily)